MPFLKIDLSLTRMSFSFPHSFFVCDQITQEYRHPEWSVKNPVEHRMTW